MFVFDQIDLVIKDIFYAKKQNVVHAFAITDSEVVNNFLKYNFNSWEYATFETFDLVKDKNSIAIDIGAWIGTTGIWLAKNFSDVICIEADNESIKHLKVNLKLSNCPNAIVCEDPISRDCSELIFGPRNVNGTWNVLNHSTSYLKNTKDSKHDYVKKCITLKKVLYDYVLDIGKQVSFIKCDIEGGEAIILDDILHYCLINNTSCYMSFHLIWWQQDVKLDMFEDYFKCFDCYDIKKYIDDPISYVKKDPFCSLLMKPKEGNKIKKIWKTVLITSYPSLDELKTILDEISKSTKDIVIVSDDDIKDQVNYFVLNNKNPEKKDKFMKFLLDSESIIIDSDKIKELLVNLDQIKENLQI